MVTATCALKPSVQKQKPRIVPLLSKADWPKFKSLMRDYQQKFLLNHFDRTVEELWSEFVSAIDSAASKCIPTKTIQGKSSLPWITQSIRRLIRRRDDLYRKFKKTGDLTFRNKLLSLRKSIKHKIKTSYNCYLEGLLWLNDENSVCDNKKLFSFLKSAKQDQTVSPPLQKGNRLVTDTTEKANTHNQQFQSVFTTKAPLSLSRLCKMQIQDMTDNGTMCHDAVPAGVLSSSPKMEEFSISINGSFKILNPSMQLVQTDSNHSCSRNCGMKLLPSSKLFSSVLSRQASSRQTGLEHKSPQSSKREINHQLRTTDPYL